MALSYFSSFKTPVSIVRPFNTYGPRQSARAVIPTIISQIASGQTKIKLGSVSPTRDFNYVEDTALGFLAALKSDQSVGEVINIGSGFEISVGDTVELIAKLMNKDIEIIFIDDTFSQVETAMFLTNFRQPPPLQEAICFANIDTILIDRE